jgi:hypothetical protein
MVSLNYRRITVAFITLLAVVAIFGAVSTFTVPPDAAAQSETVEYLWFAGVGCTPDDPPDFCPDVATASSNGDTIEIAGEGTLKVHPKEASGGGTLVHRDADGNLLGQGTFEVTELLSFKSYGAGDPDLIPADWRSGKAIFRVDLIAGGNVVAEGILTVGCRLPGAKMPGGLFEGATLNVQGGGAATPLNFNKPTTPRSTLFIEL